MTHRSYQQEKPPSLHAVKSVPTMGFMRSNREERPSPFAKKRANSVPDLRSLQTKLFKEVPVIAVPGLGSRVRNFSRKFSQASLGSSYLTDDDDEMLPLVPGMLKESSYTMALLGSVLCAVLGNFQMGFNTVILNVPEMVMKTSLGLSQLQWSIVVSSFCIGALFGSYVSGPVSDAVGRKTFITLNNIFFIIGAILQGCSVNFPMLAVGRVVVGIGAGCVTGVVPLYIGEIAPADLRGGCGALNQLAMVSGILISIMAGKPFSATAGFWSWRSLVGFVTATPAMLAMLLSPLLLESPRWFILKDRKQDAIQVLKTLRAVQEDEGPDAYELDLEALQGGNDGNTVAYNCYLLVSKFYFPLFIAVTLQLVQQMSGINAVFYYSTSFLQQANVRDPWLGSVLMGSINVIATLSSVWLLDYVGRRTILLGSTFGMLISCLGITVCLYFIQIDPNAHVLGYSLVGFLLFYVTSFAVGLGPIPWLMVAEILPAQVGGLGMSIASSINWLSNFLIGLVFPIEREMLGILSFTPFAAILLLNVLFVAEFVPETRGKSLARIQAELTLPSNEKLPADESDEEEFW